MRITLNPWRKDWVYPAVLIIAGFIYYMSYFNCGISLKDEGFFVYGAERVLRGQLPMSDFISYPPGSYFLLAFLFKVIGVNLLVSRSLEVVFLLFNGLMVFYLGKRLMTRGMALIPSFVLIAFPGPWHKVFFTFGLLLPLIALLRVLEKRSAERFLVLGGAIGVALIFKLEPALFSVATAFFILFLTYCWEERNVLIDRKRVICFLKGLSLFSFGVFGAIIPILAYYFLKDSLWKLLSSLRELNIAKVSVISKAYGQPSFIHAVTKFHMGSLSDLFFFLILFLYLYFLGKLFIQFFVRKEKEMTSVLPFVIMGTLSLTYAFSFFDKAHLLQAVAIAYILFGYLLHTLLRRKGTKSRIALVVLVMFLGLYVVDSFKWRGHFYSGSISTLYALKKERVRLLPSGKASVYVGEKDWETINGLIKFFEGKNSYLLPLRFEPMVNFLTGLENPTRFSILSPIFLAEASAQKKVIEEMKRYRIEYLLIHRVYWTEENGIGRYAPILYEYILGYYRLEKEIGNYVIFYRQSI